MLYLQKKRNLKHYNYETVQFKRNNEISPHDEKV